MTRPEAVILGSGTSNGVPMLGYEYPPGYLDDPKNHRTRSSLALIGPTGNLLVDCSPELRLQATRENLTRFEAVLITHTHADHVMGMDDLRSLCVLTRRPVTVYTLPQYQGDIRRIYPYAFVDLHPEGIEVPRFDLRDVPETLEVGGLTLRIFTVMHGTVPVVAFRVNGFAYLTDVNLIPPSAEALLQGLDVLVMDAVRYRPHPNHFHFDQAVEVAQRLGAKTTYFTHLSHDYDHTKTDATLPPGIRLAYDGLRIPV
ncbi:MAG: MBL fold metallo-hydrolase [Fimbriimonas ginsengisoli]|uniref:MBL fold metallo-hydrolase n=1 Tax=Fimbriimonas ginsengisoli TaxID=1005039 RepID=A0A931LVM6_FIMGI|nr:MBL fold metallo-hydrolase [Fimbriimonas ginsengisoli]MBI3721792.1 MBL fold metallo-hydrolase [Fimbriimonas ginsengisoli]